MIKYIILLSVVLITGCETIPTKPKFPEPPPELMIPAPDLKVI